MSSAVGTICPLSSIVTPLAASTCGASRFQPQLLKEELEEEEGEGSEGKT
jgi:hypothetical protein